jgi:DNA-binding MarR family transcriptional regulator
MNIKETIPSPEPESKQRLRLWLRLLRFNRRVEAELRERLRVNFNSTLPRFDVMSALHRNPKGLRMSELSSMLMVSNGNVTGIVERLSDDGHITRETVPGDRRAAQVRLTRKGLVEFERQAAAHEGWVNELLGAVGRNEAVLVSDLLRLAAGDEHDREHHAN